MTDEAIEPRRGKPKGDKRARTQAKLLDAALELTRERGFDRTTLQDIADRAGMSTGAIYGNFKNRDELFMALAKRQWAPIRPVVVEGANFAQIMAASAEALIAVLPERRAAAVGALTFRAYALTHEEVRRQFRDEIAPGYELGAAWFRSVCAPEDLPMDADILVRVINSLIEGLIFQHVLTPELVGEDVIRAAFAGLAKAGG